MLFNLVIRVNLSMSNKVLVSVIIIILVLFGGSVAYFRYVGNKTNKELEKQDMQGYTQDNYNNNEDSETNKAPTPTSTEAVAGSTTTTDTTAKPGECKRNFDENKLKTAQVSITNRQVAMNVKGFGTINLEFYDKDAPKTVENFLRLANSGYFDCLTFHRVAKGFVIQGGDPSGNGTGGISAFGAKFEDELNPNTPSYKAGYKKGVLAMANSGPNTNGSQFFIMLDDNELPNAYTIFGKVSSGLNVVDKIGQVDIIPQMGPTDGAPKVPVVMESVKIVK